MTANLFDAGDMQRLDREAALTEQSPRQAFHAPDESIMMDSTNEAESFSEQDDFSETNEFMSFMFDGMLDVLRSRI